METKLTRSPKEAARWILKNEVVAFPTETVYGLGANAFDELALQKIYEAKNRPNDNPLIVHFSRFNELSLLVRKVTPAAELLMEHFFPGPLTLVLPKSKYIPAMASAGLDTIGIRMPSNTEAKRFLAECGTAVAAPSANLSGKPSGTTWEAVQQDFDGRIACILMGKSIPYGLESTVVDCTAKRPMILRSGVVTLEEMKRWVPDIIDSDYREHEAPKSPGMKYRHYAPNARVILVHDTSEIPPQNMSAYIGLDDFKSDFGMVGMNVKRICPSVKEYAKDLYAFFRECDRQFISHIYCQRVLPRGLGKALMDRLEKASKEGNH